IVEGCRWTIFAQHEILWLWVPAFAGTTTSSGPRTHLRVLATRCVRGMLRNVAPEVRAWGMPGARCTRSRAWCVVNTRVSHHGYTGKRPAFPHANGFTVSFVLPGDRACLPP